MNLAKLQENFANHIYDKTNCDVLSAINSEKIPTEKRLQIYRNNIFSNFYEALNITYKITKEIVGEDYFRYLIRQYNQHYSSPSGNLEDYGAHFWKIIRKQEKEHKLYYLKDLARLEWLNNQAYFSKDAKEFNLEKLQSLSEDDFMKLHFSLHPSCQILSSQYPIYSIYNDPKKFKDAKKEAQFILIERSSHHVNLEELSAVEFDFLALIKSKKNIYQIYEILSSKYTEFDVGSLVNKFVSSKIIANFKIKK